MREATDVDIRGAAWGAYYALVSIVAVALWVIGLFLVTAWLVAAQAHAFDGETPSFPEDYGLPSGTAYQSTRALTTVGTPLNLMAYVGEVDGELRILAFPLNKPDDWLSPTQDPRLRTFAQCWMRPPTDGEGNFSTEQWCHDKVMPDGRVLPPAGTGQFYAWHDARGKFRYFCDMSCHWPGDLD